MKKRIISAIIMMIILIPALIIGGVVFAGIIAMIGVLALKELMDLKESHHKVPDLIFLISIIDLLLLIFSDFDGYSIAYGLSYKRIALTLLTLFIPTLFYKNNKYNTSDAIYLSGSVLFLGILFNGIILIRSIDIFHLVYLVLIAVLTDTFAMIIGRLIGKNKCTPVISPKKTWEGSIGGSIVSTCVCSIFYIKVIHMGPILQVLGITLILSIIGQLGDLFFSKIKRENKIKDFSNLIPGHGGVLDRIDSLSFIILTYMLLYSII